MNSRGKRMVQEDELTYLQELKAAHEDPSADWGGSGSTYTAGDGITIADETISVNYGAGLTVNDETLVVDTSTVALKSELFSGDYDDLTNKPDLSVYELAADAFSGDYDDLTNKPDIPEAPLVLTAASGTLTDEQYASLDENTVVQYQYSGITRLYYFYSNSDTQIEYRTNPIFNSSTVGNVYRFIVTKADKSYGLNYSIGNSLLPYPQTQGNFKLTSSRSGSTVTGPDWKLDYPDPDTTTAGTYNLEATVDAQGGVTYDWATGGSGSSYTFTNGLTETSGTVSWDLNNKIKSIDGSANGLGLRLEGDFGAIIGNYASTTTPSTSGSGYGIKANDSLVVAKVTGTSPKISADGCSLLLSNSGYDSTTVYAFDGSIVGAKISKSSAKVTSLNHSIVFGEVDSTSGNMTSTGKECLLVGKGLQSESNYQTVIGTDNIKDSNNTYAFIIGNGVDNSNRSNAMTVAWDGTIVSKNLPAVSGTDGTYQLTATTSSGTTTYSWAAGGSSSGKYLHKVQIFANYGGTSHIWTEDYVSSSATAYTSLTDYLTDRNYVITNTTDTLTKYMVDNVSGSNYALAVMTGTTDVYLGTITVSATPIVSASWAIQTASAIINDEVIAL